MWGKYALYGAMGRWHWLASLGTHPSVRDVLVAPPGTWKVLTWSLNFQAQVQGVKVPGGTGVTSSREIRGSAGKRIRTCRREQGWGQWVAGRVPAPPLAGVEVKHGCPSPGASVRQWQWQHCLVLGSDSEAFCQIPLCTFKKPQKIHSKITVFPKVRQAALSIFHAQGQTFPVRTAVSRGCHMLAVPPGSGSSSEHSSSRACCRLRWHWLGDGMDGGMAVRRFSFSFPLISHLLW